MNKVAQDRLTSIGVRHPHIEFKIATTWGSNECRTYLHDLLTNTRGGTRKGFESDIAKGLFYLLQAHDDSFPQFDVSRRVEPPPFRGVGDLQRAPLSEVDSLAWKMVKIGTLVILALVLLKIYFR